MIEKFLIPQTRNSSDRLVEIVEPGDFRTATANLRRVFWHGPSLVAAVALDIAGLIMGGLVVVGTVIFGIDIAASGSSVIEPTDWVLFLAVGILWGVSLIYRWTTQRSSIQHKLSVKEGVVLESYYLLFAGAAGLLMSALLLGNNEPTASEMVDVLLVIADNATTGFLFIVLLAFIPNAVVVVTALLKRWVVGRSYSQDTTNASVTRVRSRSWSSDIMITSLILALILAPLLIWLAVLDQSRGSEDVLVFYFGLFHDAIAPAVPYLIGAPIVYYLFALFPRPQRATPRPIA